TVRPTVRSRWARWSGSPWGTPGWGCAPSPPRTAGGRSHWYPWPGPTSAAGSPRTCRNCWRCPVDAADLHVTGGAGGIDANYEDLATLARDSDGAAPALAGISAECHAAPTTPAWWTSPSAPDPGSWARGRAPRW